MKGKCEGGKLWQNLEKSYIFVELKKRGNDISGAGYQDDVTQFFPVIIFPVTRKLWVVALKKHVKHEAHIQVMAIFWRIYEQHHIAAKFHRVMTHQRISWISTCFVFSWRLHSKSENPIFVNSFYSCIWILEMKVKTVIRHSQWK